MHRIVVALLAVAACTSSPGTSMELSVEHGGSSSVPASRYDTAVVEPDPRVRMRLSLQLAGALQFDAIEDVVQQLHPGRPLVVVFSPKGGVGKSTVAINIAVCMARHMSEPVALVDADVQFGDVAVLLGIPPQQTVVDAAAAVHFGDAEMMRTILTRHDSGLLVLPAPAEPSLAPTWRELERHRTACEIEAESGARTEGAGFDA